MSHRIFHRHLFGIVRWQSCICVGPRRPSVAHSTGEGEGPQLVWTRHYRSSRACPTAFIGGGGGGGLFGYDVRYPRNNGQPDAPFGWYLNHRGRAPGAPGIQINVPAICHIVLPPNITPSSSPGYLTPAVSGAHMRAEWLHHPCLLGGPQHGDKKWGKMGTTGGK